MKDYKSEIILLLGLLLTLSMVGDTWLFKQLSNQRAVINELVCAMVNVKYPGLTPAEVLQAREVIKHAPVTYVANGTINVGIVRDSSGTFKVLR